MEHLPWSLVRVLGTTLVLGSPVAYYVHRDRKRRGQNRSVLWAIGLGLLGLSPVRYSTRTGEEISPRLLTEEGARDTSFSHSSSVIRVESEDNCPIERKRSVGNHIGR